WFETVHFMRDDKDETIRLTEPATKLPPDIASKVYDLEMPAMSTTGHFDEKALAATMQSFLDVGVLEKLPDNPRRSTPKSSCRSSSSAARLRPSWCSTNTA